MINNVIILKIIKNNTVLDIEKRLEFLPILPEKVNYLLNLKYDNKYDTKKLVEIIEQDSILSTKLLQLANSKYFGFLNAIYTPSRALSLYGVNFTIAICVSELILNSIKFDMDLYNARYSDFKIASDLSLKLLLEYFDEDEADIKENLIMPLFVQYIGKFIISSYLKNENKIKNFDLFNQDIPIANIERKVIGLTSSELTSLILKRWGFPQSIVDLVFYIDRPMYLDRNVKEICILNVINTACNIQEPLSLNSINLALDKANEYDLNVNHLKKAIKKIKNDYTNK